MEMSGATPRAFTKRILTQYLIYIIIGLKKGCPILRLEMDKVPTILQVRKLRPNRYISLSVALS